MRDVCESEIMCVGEREGLRFCVCVCICVYVCVCVCLCGEVIRLSGITFQVWDK